MERTALGYVRISKDEPGSASLAYQRGEIERFCEAKGLVLVGTEADNGISGATISARPGVQRVLRAVEANEIDAVVVFKSDRMSRDGLESVQVDRLFQRTGVTYVSVTEGILSDDSADSEFMGFIRAGLNQRERKIIGLRTRKALAQRKAEGVALGTAPYGFRRENGKFIPNDQEQIVISRMKELQGLGYSTREIVTALEREGYRTRKGTVFTQTQICRVLRVA